MCKALGSIPAPKKKRQKKKKKKSQSVPTTENMNPSYRIREERKILARWSRITKQKNNSSNSHTPFFW
jgi:hypothetical protein